MADHSARETGWWILLWALALTLPLGALAQPWLFPSRSAMPVVPRQPVAPSVLITVGGLSASRVHHLGHARETTPNLDALVRHGLSITETYANGNHELVTTASAMTAECPVAHGVQAPGDVLAPRLQTLAERLAADGVSTAAFVGNPALIGRGLDQGFDLFEARPGGSADELLTEALAHILDPPDPRQFVWIDLADLLAPYGGAGLDPTRFDPTVPAGFADARADYGLPIEAFAARGWGRTEAGWFAARYDAALFELDAALGRFLDALDAAGELDYLTLTVLGTSGARLDEHPGFVGGHAVDLFDPSIKVPLLMRLPGQAVRGLELRRLAQPSDVGPTLLRLATRRSWEDGVGRDLERTIRLQQDLHGQVFSSGRLLPVEGGEPRAGLAVRYKGVKLLGGPHGEQAQLFELATDPGELFPVTLQPAQVEAIFGMSPEWHTRCDP